MYNYPEQDYYSYNNSIRQARSYMRIFNAAIGMQPVDVYINNTLIALRLQYQEFTEYLPLQPGYYNIKVYPAGTSQNPIANIDLNFPAQSIYTLAITGQMPDINILPIPDPIRPMDIEKVYLRFGNLSPNMPNVDITFPDGTIIFGDVAYREVTDYIPLNPGLYILEARLSGTSRIILTVPNIHLKPHRFYSVYAVGLVQGNPPLQVVIPLDGNSYLHV